jgi:hypothetical protein
MIAGRRPTLGAALLQCAREDTDAGISYTTELRSAFRSRRICSASQRAGVGAADSLHRRRSEDRPWPSGSICLRRTISTALTIEAAIRQLHPFVRPSRSLYKNALNLTTSNVSCGGGAGSGNHCYSFERREDVDVRPKPTEWSGGPLAALVGGVCCLDDGGYHGTADRSGHDSRMAVPT